MQTVIAPEARYLAAAGRPVKKGEEVEVPDHVAASLIAQGWRSKRSVAAKKAARKRADVPEPTVADQADTEE